ncbi:MAG: hypothetical protein K2J75_02420 [Clostridia bacterium]|nr:hypothetical protein [Clostridia bacterium]
MARNKNSRLLVALIPILVLVIFNILVFAIAGSGIKEKNTSFWVGYGFITAGFLMMTGAMASSKLGKGKIFNELVPNIIIVAAYAVINLIVNIIAMAVDKQNATAFVIIDVILFIVLIIFEILVFLGTRQIKTNRKEVQNKVNYINHVKTSCELLLDRTDDAQVKDALKKLLDDIAYSDPMSGYDSEITKEERKLKSLIEVLEDDIESASAEVLLQNIKSASNCLKKRNALIKAAKS